MKILAIGDPHGNLKQINKINLKHIDLILLTGDLGSSNLVRKMSFDNIARQKQGLPKLEYSPRQRKLAFMESYNSTIKLIKYLAKFAPVYTIFGNVESSNAETREYSQDIGLKLPYLYNELKLISGVRIINNVVVNFNGIRIGGLDYFVDTSWIREFKPSDFNKSMAGAKRETDKAKRILRNFGSLDILVCHQPPYGILDKVTSKFAPKGWNGKHAGSKAILDYVRKYHPAYVLCGHIHENEGKANIGKTRVYNLGTGGYVVLDF